MAANAEKAVNPNPRLPTQPKSQEELTVVHGLTEQELMAKRSEDLRRRVFGNLRGKSWKFSADPPCQKHFHLLTDLCGQRGEAFRRIADQSDLAAMDPRQANNSNE